MENDLQVDETHSGDELFLLTSFVWDLKLQLMLWIVQMGFETDIYQDHELGSLYW